MTHSDSSFSDWLAAVKERAEKATPGPWAVMAGGFGRVKQPHVSSVYFAGDELLYVARCGDCYHMDLGMDRHDPPADADFIAHAREDVPRLLAALARLTAENAALTHQSEQNYRNWRETERYHVNALHELKAREREIETLKDQARQSEAENAALRNDQARLDWLADEALPSGDIVRILRAYQVLRETTG